MRPPILDPYFSHVSRLSGIGPKLAPLFDRVTNRPPGEARLLDLVFHLPVDLINRAISPSITAAAIEGTITVEAVVEAHRPAPPGRAKAPHRVVMGDETGDLTLVYFRMPKAQIETMLPIGARRIVSGPVELFDGMRQMVHPERVWLPERYTEADAIEPVYPLTEGLTSKRIGNTAKLALEKLPALPEWLEDSLLARERWPGFGEALNGLHSPQEAQGYGPESPAYKRLAYDELFASQLALLLMRQHFRNAAGESVVGDGRISSRIRAALPYTLTGAQDRAIEAILADMADDERMLRLVQGDVGAGKTIVALLAMAAAVEAGKQAAMMAPTDLLARQHFERLSPLCEAAGMRIALVTGRAGAAERARVRAALEKGEVDIAIGTHALFQDDVRFKALALAVVDEQHRFGVHQRLKLAAKGEAVDLLVMTATPIPRTLVLGYFGDLDVSVLDEKPPGRKPIDTRLINAERIGEVVAGIGRAIEESARAYWVCPLVAESEKLDLAAASERFEDLSKHFPGRVGLIHGKMPGAEKDAAMAAFASGALSILVSTTVIEVGVDVPEASIMVIEEAQRFGLAQLHQLRGRVGRGAAQSRAILLYRGPLSETGEARLKIMRETEDGFRIAEEDLRLRGEGDLLGTRQSGLPGFRIARLDLHQALLRIARDDAAVLLQRDPDLVSQRGLAARLLLALFEREEAIRLINSG